MLLVQIHQPRIQDENLPSEKTLHWETWLSVVIQGEGHPGQGTGSQRLTLMLLHKSGLIRSGRMFRSYVDLFRWAHVNCSSSFSGLLADKSGTRCRPSLDTFSLQTVHCGDGLGGTGGGPQFLKYADQPVCHQQPCHTQPLFLPPSPHCGRLV